LEKVNWKPADGIVLTLRKENPRHFDVTIVGPKGSCYENGVFKLELFLPKDYPMVAPKVHFLTPIYHPNIDRVGRICLDVLKPDKWSPALQIPAVCLSIQQLMSSPEPSDPLDPIIAKHWKENRKAAESTAREWVGKFAK